MEDIVSEKFEDVSIARIRPTWVQFKPDPWAISFNKTGTMFGEGWGKGEIDILCSLIDETQLGHQSHDTSILHFSPQLILQHIRITM